MSELISTFVSKEQASLESEQELFRNLLHRVAVDGTKDFNLLQYIQGAAATLASTLIRGPDKVVTLRLNDAAVHVLIPGAPGMQIVVFDILLSVNAPAVISLQDDAGNDLLCPMFAPNAGQGFSMNSFRGKYLPPSRGLCVTSTAAIDYGIDVSYTLIELPPPA